MDAVMSANTLLAGLNAVLALVLLVLYARMLRQVATGFTVGLAAFAFVLLFQSGIQLYFYLSMTNYYAGGVGALVLVQNVLATAALALLAFVTLAPAGARLAGPAAESGKTAE